MNHEERVQQVNDIDMTFKQVRQKIDDLHTGGVIATALCISEWAENYYAENKTYPEGVQDYQEHCGSFERRDRYIDIAYTIEYAFELFKIDPENEEFDGDIMAMFDGCWDFDVVPAICEAVLPEGMHPTVERIIYQMRILKEIAQEKNNLIEADKATLKKLGVEISSYSTCDEGIRQYTDSRDGKVYKFVREACIVPADTIVQEIE